jgi:acetylornithine deacetylase/succinyl-diaminopimelate desuccinylase-like protein
VGAPSSVMAPTFLADTARLEYLCWYPPGMTAADALAEVREQLVHAAGLDPWLREHPPVVEQIMDVGPVEIPPDHPLCRALGNAHEAAAVGTRMAGRPDVAAFRAASDATWLDRAGVPVAVYGPGDIRHAHSNDERVAVDEYLCAIRTFALVAVEWCGVADGR